MRHKTIISIAFLVLSCSPSQAADCAANLQVEQGVIGKIIQCLSQMEQENLALRGEIAALKSASAKPRIPPGAVMAFDLTTGCPNGWAHFEPAISRTIVGAVGPSRSMNVPIGLRDEKGRALTARQFRTTGGEERHVLSIGELAGHTHKMPHTFAILRRHASKTIDLTSLPVKDTTDLALEYAYLGDSKHDKYNFAERSGESAAHNNMMPFIALYFCKKENG